MQFAAINELARPSRLSTLAIVLVIATPLMAQEALVEVGATPSQDVVVMSDTGLDKAIVALPTVVTDTMARSGVPGVAVAVVHGGKVIFKQGYGVRELGKAAPVEPETVFQIASLSKPLTASVIAVEATKGVVAWDDPVARHLPGFTLRDPYVAAHATIGDFMAHHSGLPFAAGDNLEDLGYDRRQIIERISQLPLDAFRASYHYANFGTTVAAEAVAGASGNKWEDLAEQALFKPLGMLSTSSRHADYLARDNRAVLHALEDGKFQPIFDRNPDEQSPAGGVSSTVLDLAQWLNFLLASGQHDGEQLASADALQAAMSPHSLSAPARNIDARPGFYGYGFNIGINANGRTSFSHSGAFVLGAATSFQIIPSADIGIVVLTNGSPVGAAESIGMHFMDIVQYGEPLRDWYAGYNALLRSYFDPVGDLVGKAPPAPSQSAQVLEAYAGRYQSAYFGTAEIEVDQQQLILTLGPRRERFAMVHWDGDTFAIAPRSENAPEGSLSSVRFSMHDGKSDGFTINYLDQNGMATWQR
jgi:CubicO group peptidase (beta-lactamase class C family)